MSLTHCVDCRRELPWAHNARAARRAQEDARTRAFISEADEQAKRHLEKHAARPATQSALTPSATAFGPSPPPAVGANSGSDPLRAWKITGIATAVVLIPAFIVLLIVSPRPYKYSEPSSSVPSTVVQSPSSSEGVSASGSYSIISRQEGPSMKVAQVGASKSQLESWTREIEASERAGGKDFTINFHNGGPGAGNIVASYQGGSLYMTR